MTDLERWDDAFFHGRVVPAAVVRMMATPVKSDYGYGWAIYYYHRGTGVPGHNGSFPGAHAMNLYYPPADMEVIVLTNLMQSLPEEIAAQVLGVALHWRQMPGIQSAHLSARELESVTGLYDLGPGGNGARDTLNDLIPVQQFVMPLRDWKLFGRQNRHPDGR